MEQLLLKDVCTFANGKAHEQFVDENGEYILVTSKFIASDGESFRRTNDRLTPLEIGDLCMVMSDVPKGRALAKCFLVDENDLYTLNQRIGVFKADIRYLKKYFYYMMNRNKYFLSFDDGDSQTNLRKDDILNCPVICPSKEEQQLVVDILDKVAKVIEKRKQEIAALDELIKARFVELFGNPVLNDKDWEQKYLAEITTKIGSGATPKGGKEAYQEEGITFIRSMNVRNGQFEYKDLAHISDEQAAKLDNVILEENDVLLNITGASVARSCVVPNEILPARVNQHVCIIRCKDCIIPEFLNKLLIDDNYQDLLWNIAGSGATREAITKQQVENLQIILPPIELQKEFMTFCKQVDKSKVAVQKALTETQLLFDSLMQEYFG